jgi:hypothetical protein
LCAIGNEAAVRVLPAATRFGRAASVDTLAAVEAAAIGD